MPQRKARAGFSHPLIVDFIGNDSLLIQALLIDSFFQLLTIPLETCFTAEPKVEESRDRVMEEKPGSFLTTGSQKANKSFPNSKSIL